VRVSTEDVRYGGGEKTGINDNQNLSPELLASLQGEGRGVGSYICECTSVVVQLHTIHRIPPRPHSRSENQYSNAMECESCASGCSCSFLCCFGREGRD
jgi:hypothetical protein